MNALLGILLVLAIVAGVVLAVSKRQPDEESESETPVQTAQPTANLVEERVPEPGTTSEPEPTVLKARDTESEATVAESEPEPTVLKARDTESGATVEPPAATSDRRPPILAAASTGNPDDIPLLAQLAVDSDDEIRQAVAASIGRMAGETRLGVCEERAIELAGTLSRDRSSPVRQAAIEALGRIPSAKVIPHLQQGLRDPEPEVVRSASAALDRYKFYPSRDRAPEPPKPANAAPRETNNL